MTPANILVQPPGLKTSEIIQYSNQESQNSLTQRIIPQLHCVRKLSFHETEKFIFKLHLPDIFKGLYIYTLKISDTYEH